MLFRSLPKNTAEVLSKYKKVVVAEQNNGQFANYLRGKVPRFTQPVLAQIEGSIWLSYLYHHNLFNWLLYSAINSLG